MSIKVMCPACHKEFHAPDEAAGRRAKCPKCEQPFVISAAMPDSEYELEDPIITPSPQPELSAPMAAPASNGTEDHSGWTRRPSDRGSRISASRTVKIVSWVALVLILICSLTWGYGRMYQVVTVGETYVASGFQVDGEGAIVAPTDEGGLFVVAVSVPHALVKSDTPSGKGMVVHSYFESVKLVFTEGSRSPRYVFGDQVDAPFSVKLKDVHRVSFYAMAEQSEAPPELVLNGKSYSGHIRVDRKNYSRHNRVGQEGKELFDLGFANEIGTAHSGPFLFRVSEGTFAFDERNGPIYLRGDGMAVPIPGVIFDFYRHQVRLVFVRSQFKNWPPQLAITKFKGTRGDTR